MTAPPADRRPVATRRTRWARAVAAGLTRLGATPNGLSATGVIVAAGGAAAFVLWGRGGPGWLLLLAAAGIQLRLLCNMLDGLVAVEGGLGSPAGDVWNDLPDRIEDALFLVAAGWALPIPHARDLGWLAALLAVGTAYVRLLGGALKLPQDFRGPMAKPQRMATMTVAALLEALFAATGTSATWPRGSVLAIGLVVVVVGSLATAVRRSAGILAGLAQRR